MTIVSRREFLAATACSSAVVAGRAFGEAKAPDASVRFLVFADLHCYDFYPNGDLSFVDEILLQARAENCKFVIQLGDLVHNVADPMQKECVRRCNECGIPFYHVLGNHDQEETPYRDVVAAYRMPGNYYSFDCGGFRFIALDANYTRSSDGGFVHFELGRQFKLKDGEVNDWIPPQEVDWFRRTIAESPYPCVVMAHHCFDRPSVFGGVQNGEEIREIIDSANVRRSGSVRLVMNGHHHIDNLRILERVLYWDVNSASYMIFSGKHDKYPSDYVEKHGASPHCLAWDRPLYAVVTIWTNGRVRIEGRRAGWRYGVTPDKAGFPRHEQDGRYVVPWIRSADLTFGY